MAVTASKADEVVRDGAIHKRWRANSLTNADTVVEATPGSGFTHVVTGWQIIAASAALNLVVEDGSDNTKVSLLLPEAVSAAGRPILPPPAEPGTMWVPIGDDEPLEVRTSTGTAELVLYYITIPTAAAGIV